jgi:hypothetical protein
MSRITSAGVRVNSPGIGIVVGAGVRVVVGEGVGGDSHFCTFILRFNEGRVE